MMIRTVKDGLDHHMKKSRQTMRRDKTANTITFDNDQEFTDWAVVQSTVVSRTETGIAYTDFDMTDDYYKSLEEGTRLYIIDPASQIVKHQCVTFHSDSHPVQVYPVVNKSKYMSKES